MALSPLSSHTTVVLLKCSAPMTSLLSPSANTTHAVINDVDLSPRFSLVCSFSSNYLRGLGRAVIVSCLLIVYRCIASHYANVKYMFTSPHHQGCLLCPFNVEFCLSKRGAGKVPRVTLGGGADSCMILSPRNHR